jgi:hypothetical protein
MLADLCPSKSCLSSNETPADLNRLPNVCLRSCTRAGLVPDSCFLNLGWVQVGYFQVPYPFLHLRQLHVSYPCIKYQKNIAGHFPRFQVPAPYL